MVHDSDSNAAKTCFVHVKSGALKGNFWHPPRVNWPPWPVLPWSMHSMQRGNKHVVSCCYFHKICCYKVNLFSIVAFKTLEISQGSVATYLRCGGIFSDSIITNFPPDSEIILTRCSAIAERSNCREREFSPKVEDWNTAVTALHHIWRARSNDLAAEIHRPGFALPIALLP